MLPVADQVPVAGSYTSAEVSSWLSSKSRPPTTRTRPSRSGTTRCSRRGVPALAQWPSTCPWPDRTERPGPRRESLSLPPATSTLPSASVSPRGRSAGGHIDPVAVQVPLSGSYTSGRRALAMSTRPSGSNVTSAQRRARSMRHRPGDGPGPASRVIHLGAVSWLVAGADPHEHPAISEQCGREKYPAAWPCPRSRSRSRCPGRTTRRRFCCHRRPLRQPRARGHRGAARRYGRSGRAHRAGGDPDARVYPRPRTGPAPFRCWVPRLGPRSLECLDSDRR